MTTYSKLNIVYRLQKWMDSVPGQTFLNYAYSWGASIVILGTLFKLTHLPGANFFLFLGMGTEVFVFFISAFDRPFDKTTDGMELDTHVQSSENLIDGTDAEQIPVSVGGVSGGVVINGGGVTGEGDVISGGSSGGATVVGGGGTIIIGGGGGSSQEAVDTEAIAAIASSVAAVSRGETDESAGTGESGTIGVSGVSAMTGLPTVNPELEEATATYVDELKRLTEMLSKVSEQSERLARDSEEMENLNRTLTGICKVYEMQLKSASSQIGTIDDINAQTKRMAEQIAELNSIYARMIEAMSARVNP